MCDKNNDEKTTENELLNETRRLNKRTFFLTIVIALSALGSMGIGVVTAKPEDKPSALVVEIIILVAIFILWFVVEKYG